MRYGVILSNSLRLAVLVALGLATSWPTARAQEKDSTLLTTTKTTNVFTVSSDCKISRVVDVDTSKWLIHGARHANPSIAYRWVDVIEEAAARRIDKVGAKPTVISREMAIAVTAMYDAWAAYDTKAVGTRLGSSLRSKIGDSDQRQKSKETAISYAAYRALCYAYADDVPWLTEQARQFNVDPEITTTDCSCPEGIGNKIAAALIAYRQSDGSNQEGSMPGCNQKPYSDYTGYQCVNPDPAIIHDPDFWQPIPFDDGKGGKVLLGYLTPHWGLVKSLGLDRNDQFRAPPPPRVGSAQLKSEIDQLIEWNATLTPEQKAIVEFMRDGPRSTGQSGHWLRFAQDVSTRDRYDLDQDVKLFFCIGNVCMDAFISCWETKRFYNTSRPWTLVRYYYKGRMVRGWGGPCKGAIELPAEEWHPYSPFTFVTPPFPAYTSGHATVSGASAKILELLTGSDKFECIERRDAGSLTEGVCDLRKMQAVDGVPDIHQPNTPTQELALATFSGTADMAALSRALGGYHIMTDNIAGLDCGRKLAVHCMGRYQSYFDGTAEVRP